MKECSKKNIRWGFLKSHLFMRLGFIALIAFVFSGCVSPYESELLDSHNRFVEIDKNLVQANLQVLDSQRAFVADYNRQRLDIAKANFDSLRSELTLLNQDIVNMYPLLQQEISEAARFAGYTSALQDEKKRSADEFVSNIKLGDKYYGLALDELRESTRQYNAALDLFQTGSFDEANLSIDQAVLATGRYDVNISIQNDYAARAIESKSKLVVAMGWKELAD